MQTRYTRIGESYAAWAGRLFGAAANDPAQGGATADFDKDGILNLLEYAMGLDPTVTDTAPLTVRQLPSVVAQVRVRR